MWRLWNMPDKKIILILSSILFMFLTSSTAFSGQREINDAKRKVIISTDKANVDFKKDVFSIPGNVSISSDDINIIGKSLRYDNKKKIAVLSGSPIEGKFGKNVTFEAKNMTIDFENSLARTLGESTFIQDNDDSRIEIISEGISYDFNDNILNSTNTVKAKFTNKKEDQKQDGNGKKEIYVKSASFIADEITLDVERKKYECSGNVRFETEDSNYIEAEKISGDYLNKTAKMTGRPHGRFKDYTLESDVLDIDYEAKIITMKGNVKVEKNTGEGFESEKVVMRYGEGDRSLSIDGGVKIRVNMDENIKKKQEEGVKK